MRSKKEPEPNSNEIKGFRDAWRTLDEGLDGSPRVFDAGFFSQSDVEVGATGFGLFTRRKSRPSCGC